MLGSLLMIGGGAVLALSGGYQLEVVRRGQFSVVSPQRLPWRMTRQVFGLVVGGILGLLVAGLVPALALEGAARLMALVAAGAVVLAFGFVIPRAPQVREERRRRAIRLALPAALTQWRISLQSAGAKTTLAQVMKTYVAVPRPERVDLQAVIGEAFAAMEAGATRTRTDGRTGEAVVERLLFAEALLEAAERSGCPEAINVMTILANADRTGGIKTALPALERASDQLAKTIGHEIDELITKRGLKLIAAAAPAVMGSVILILYIVSGGGTMGSL